MIDYCNLCEKDIDKYSQYEVISFSPSQGHQAEYYKDDQITVCPVIGWAVVKDHCDTERDHTNRIHPVVIEPDFNLIQLATEVFDGSKYDDYRICPVSPTS